MIERTHIERKKFCKRIYRWVDERYERKRKVKYVNAKRDDTLNDNALYKKTSLKQNILNQPK